MPYDQKKYHERRELIRATKNVPCTLCRGRFPTVCMDFHHRDPATKEFKIAGAVTVAMKRLLAEIAKCDVYCSNCHRIISHLKDDD